jgi:hypothetical protein
LDVLGIRDFFCGHRDEIKLIGAFGEFLDAGLIRDGTWMNG